MAFYSLNSVSGFSRPLQIDMVPNLSPQNLTSIEIGKDFMQSHGYIKNDFDVHEWAAPEFLEQVAKELLEERWQKVTTDKLPEAASLRIGQPTSQQSEKVIC